MSYSFFMYKDFDDWNILKKKLEKIQRGKIYFKNREIWWCSLGVNLGSEICGKNILFERPVLILKKINKDLFIGLPFTGQYKNVEHHILVNFLNKDSFTALEQVRCLSAKRLTRKICTLEIGIFCMIKEKYKTYI